MSSDQVRVTLVVDNQAEGDLLPEHGLSFGDCKHSGICEAPQPGQTDQSHDWRVSSGERRC